MGLLADFVGFSLLARDLMSAFQSERKAWDLVTGIRKNNAKTAGRSFLGTTPEEASQRNKSFEDRINIEVHEFETEILRRTLRVGIGIALVLSGFVLQCVGVVFPYLPN